MAQLKVPISDFHITSPYRCITTVETLHEPNHQYMISQNIYAESKPATKVTVEKTFNFALPNGASVKSAKVCVDSMSSTYGAEVSTINGVSVGVKSGVSVDVAIGNADTSITIPFVFQSNSPAHDHFTDNSGTWLGNSFWVVDYLYNQIAKDHEGVLQYSGVYLLIDYDPALEFSGWTDDPLVVGETFVKAVHMTELQQWTAVLSEYADNGTPTFTEAVPGETSLALWLSQVQEIRAVLDVVSPNHEAWIDVSVNCPRADVMTQIRKIIVAAM